MLQECRENCAKCEDIERHILGKEYIRKREETMGTAHDEEIEIDLKEIYYALKKKILVIVAAAILLGGVAFAYTFFLLPPVYTSTSSILVLTKETTLSSLADLQMGSQLTNDYRVLLTSRPVLEDVIENLELDMDYAELKEMITVENPKDTRILEITVDDISAEGAAEIVNELTQIASAFIGEKMEVVPPKIIEKGQVAEGKSGPNTLLNTLLGLVAGIVLSAGVVTAMTIMDDTIKSEDDIEKYLQLPTLASVPDRKDYINVDKSKVKKKNRRKNRKKRG